MAILTCVIKKPPIEKGAETKIGLFNALKENGLSLEVVKSVVSVIGGGEEVTFVSQDALASFLVAAKSDWEVESDYSPEVTVTLAPLAGYGHSLVEDRAIVAALSVRCKVIEGRRCTYEEAPSIENGVRKYKVEQIKQNMGGTLKFGPTVFSVRHRGQVKTCNKCGMEGHISKNCEKGWPCHKCGEEGHILKECPNSVRCSICRSEEHAYKQCPNTYAFRTKVGNQWGRVAAATDEECLEAGVAAEKVCREKAGKENGVAGPADLSVSPIKRTSLDGISQGSVDLFSGITSVPDSQESTSQTIDDESESGEEDEPPPAYNPKESKSNDSKEKTVTPQSKLAGSRPHRTNRAQNDGNKTSQGRGKPSGNKGSQRGQAKPFHV